MEDHLTTLIAGGCLCVPSEGHRLNIEDLAAFSARSRANWAHITPSLAEILRPREMSSLRTLVLGGEPMTAGNVEAWARRPSRPNNTLVQVYGPAECCVTSTIAADVSPGSPETNIGIALRGCATWIARTENPDVLCPIGAVGELLVEGVRKPVRVPGLEQTYRT